MELTTLISLFLFQLLLILIMVFDYRKSKSTSTERLIDGLTVLIPFRNEEHRIISLINSLNNSSLNGNFEIIFIDDHSTDISVEVVEHYMEVPFKLLKLDEKKGKKWAIDLGVMESKFENILTLDADVSFDKRYLESICTIEENDLTVLPVSMKGKSWSGKLSGFEFNWLQLLTFFSFTGKYPILCNGANLLFNKKAYLEVKNDRTDFDIPSGDDIFLLDAFKKKNKKIKRYTDARFSVTTIALDSIKKLVLQRKRWISKMNKKLSISMIMALFIMFLTQIGLFSSIYWSFWNLLFLIPIGIKVLAESLIQIYLQRHENGIKLVGLTIIHQIWYPVFVLMMVIPFKDRSRWARNK